MKPLYWRSRTENSYCPECGESAMLLATDYPCLPSFYVCTGGGCAWVGQVGVGPVPDVTPNADEEEDEEVPASPADECAAKLAEATELLRDLRATYELSEHGEALEAFFGETQDPTE